MTQLIDFVNTLLTARDRQSSARRRTRFTTRSCSYFDISSGTTGIAGSFRTVADLDESCRTERQTWHGSRDCLGTTGRLAGNRGSASSRKPDLLARSNGCRKSGGIARLRYFGAIPDGPRIHVPTGSRAAANGGAGAAASGMFRYERELSSERVRLMVGRPEALARKRSLIR